MASEGDQILVDALPYCDQGYEIPGVRENVQRQLDEEMRRYRPTKNYLAKYPLKLNTFETPALKIEMERIAQHQPMETLNMRRYDLPQMSPAQMNDLAAWQDAVDNSQSQLEHQAGRLVNLELLVQYGSNAWRVHNDLLQRMVDNEQKKLKELRSRVQDTNWKRKTEQTKAGEELVQLETHWQNMVYKNFEIEKVCLQMEAELGQLKQTAKERCIHIE